MSPRAKASVALILLVPAPSLGVICGLWLWPGATGKVMYLLCKAWMMLLPVVWHLRVDRQPLSASPVRRGGLFPGALLGVALSVLIVAFYWLLGRHWIEPAAVAEMAKRAGIADPLFYIGFALWLTLGNALAEEYVWRWFCFRKCEAIVPSFMAIVLSAVFFTIHHVIALRSFFDWRVTILASAGVLFGGAIWSWLYLRYRSVWPCWVSHAIADAAIFAIGAHLIFG